MYCTCPVFLLPPATTVPAVLMLPLGAPTPGTVVLPTPSLAFFKEKGKLLYWQGPKKYPEYCLQSAEIYYDRTTRAENEDASGKKNAVAYDEL